MNCFKQSYYLWIHYKCI